MQRLGMACLVAVALFLTGAAERGPGGTVTVTATFKGQKVKDVAVWLPGVKGIERPEALRLLVDQQNKTFIPHIGLVMKGGVVEFRNSDDCHCLHNTYASCPAAKFTLNEPGLGSRGLTKVDTEGVIEVRCHIHAQMLAYVLVVDTPLFAVTDAKNADTATITGVPDGTVAVRAWSEKYGLTEGSVTVRAGQVGTAVLAFNPKKGGK